MQDYQIYQQQVVTVSRLLTEKGLLMGTGGNVSARLPGQAAMAVTPSNFDYLQMGPEDVCVVGWEGGNELQTLAGLHKPSIESPMHAAIYQARQDAAVVVHTHQPFASACALVGQDIPALFDEQVRFLGRSVEVVPYAPSGTGFLKGNIVRKLRSMSNAYLLQNHGALLLAPDAERAIFNVELLEKCAQAFLLALYTEARIARIPLPIREIIMSKLRHDQRHAAAQLVSE